MVRLSHIPFSILLFGLFVIAGCSKKDVMKPLPSYTNLATLIGGEKKLTLFTLALQKCGLDGMLSDNKKLTTVFAPSDSAFNVEGLTKDSIGRMDLTRLGTLMRFHMADGNFPAGNFLPQYVFPLKMLDSLTTSVQVVDYITIGGVTEYNPLTINGAFIDTRDIQAQNGVLHILDQVMNFPDHSVLQFIEMDPNLTDLAAAMRAVGWDSTFLSSSLPITIFAPTNAALSAAGLGDTTQYAANVDKVYAAIAPSLVQGSALVAAPNMSGYGYDGSFLLITGNPGAFQVGEGFSGQGPKVNLVVTNRIGKDGAFHKIDHILRP